MAAAGRTRRDAAYCSAACQKAAWEVRHRPARDEGTETFTTLDGTEIRFTPLRPGELQTVGLEELERADERDLEAAK